VEPGRCRGPEQRRKVVETHTPASWDHGPRGETDQRTQWDVGSREVVDADSELIGERWGTRESEEVTLPVEPWSAE
jgi:hypothetical protein